VNARLCELYEAFFRAYLDTWLVSEDEDDGLAPISAIDEPLARVNAIYMLIRKEHEREGTYPQLPNSLVERI
jgi:hypothetical protein